MFIGHYGPALALQPAARQVPLWALFVSVQLNDILWALLHLGGLEQATVHHTGVFLTPLSFPDLNLSHSLATTALWALAAGALAALVWRKAGARGAFLVVALAVLSHWVLDLVMQRADLPLWPGGPKLGFGLLDQPGIAITLELGLLIAGLVLYMRTTRARRPMGDFAPIITGMIIVFSYGVNTLSPPPETANDLAWMALLTFAAFAGLAAWMDHTREPKQPV